MLSTIYPEHKWLPWKFAAAQPGFWGDKNNQKLFLDWVEKELNIQEKSDWYKVSQKVIFNLKNIILNLKNRKFEISEVHHF